jgi:hypothetical protein
MGGSLQKKYKGDKSKGGFKTVRPGESYSYCIYNAEPAAERAKN